MRRDHVIVATAAMSLILLGTVAAQDPVKPPDSKGPTAPNSQEPTERFRLWDRNQDGKLSRDELPEGVRANFDRVDTNGDGFISPEEDRLVGQGPPGAQAKAKGARAGSEYP